MSASRQQPLREAGPGGAPIQKKPYPFWLGGASACCAATITHPLDLTKYRLQTATVKRGMFATIISTAKSEGITSLWHGLTATWLRQFSYSLTRFAVYEKTKASFLSEGKTKPTSLELAFAAGLGGGVASIVGNPAEIVLVRTCSDLNRAPAERFAYGNAVNGLVRVVRDDGVKILVRGMEANVVKGATLNVGQLAGYDFFKNLLESTKAVPDGMVVTAATFCAGTAATTLAQPVDFIKSRVQNNKDPSATLVSIIRGAVKKDGPTVFFRGWTPAWLRLQPQTTLLFYFFEAFKGIIDKQRQNADKLGSSQGVVKQ
ncbi:mitochondrial carrier [Ceraceosorus guamensis]|uniref:Mitochondrial carrier n=1 Tax=Ceraceosorus guamensis TaxID=1522189 RepID=A0A316VXK3_9BASI|nr:mitochondrial carrier [Ceraceosorus guamensis]PWN41163.1 mitochondrial carrier [Ceraceosorus guamensis]